MTQRRNLPVNPAVIWRWGFSLVLVAVGVWLVVTNPPFGGSNGRLFGWIIIAYGVIRLLLQRLFTPSRGKREQDSIPKSA